MASETLYLRSDSDKGGTPSELDLWLRSDADKTPGAGGWTTFELPVGTVTSWTWASGEYDVDSSFRATSNDSTAWTWGIIYSSTSYYYRSGNPLYWIWVSGSHE